MRTPSLRRRAVLWSVGVLALLLVVVGVGVDLVLGSTLKGEQRQRLVSLAALSTELTGLSDQSLADRLSMPGVTATVRSAASGDEVVGVPQAPPADRRRGAPPAPPHAAASTAVVRESRGRMTVEQAIRPGVTLVLTSDSGPIDAVLARFRLIMSIAGAAAVALAAVLLRLVLGRALRPLDALTSAAQETAQGGRGRRLDPQDPRTDLGRAARQFDAMLEELEGAERSAEEAAERLARFLSDASHELRTPLAGVSAAAERLIRDPLAAPERDRVAVQLVREARRAGRLVDDLLLASRLGELAVRTVPRRLDALLVDAAERARSMRGGLEEVERDLAEGVVIPVDPLRFDQVLANLLANAATAGARRARIRMRQQGAAAVVRISDDGPGIPAAAREAVFERLVRLDPARAAAGGGAGLGLPIARGLVAAHGGTLRCVEGTVADLPGAVFELVLPARSAPGSAPDADASAREPAVVA